MFLNIFTQIGSWPFFSWGRLIPKGLDGAGRETRRKAKEEGDPEWGSVGAGGCGGVGVGVCRGGGAWVWGWGGTQLHHLDLSIEHPPLQTKRPGQSCENI